MVMSNTVHRATSKWGICTTETKKYVLSQRKDLSIEGATCGTPGEVEKELAY